MKKFFQIAGIAGFAVLALGSMVGLAQQDAGAVVLFHLIAGGILVLVGILTNIPEMRDFLARRSVRMGPQVLLQAILIAAILFFVNVLVKRHDYIKDMTDQELYTLGRATEDVMQNLPGEVTVMAFFPGGGDPEARQRLELYDARFDKVDLQFIDPNKNEDIARAEEVPPQPGVLFKFQGEKVWITRYNEMDITNAFIKVTRTTKPVVWFSTGHGEPDLESEGPNGLAYLKQLLAQQGYKAMPKDLSTVEQIPQDVSMVAAVGPAVAFSDHEIRILDYYMANGGNAMFFLDPVWEEGAATGLEAFLEAYGLRVNWDLAFDPESHLAEDNTGIWIVARNFPSHPITQSLTEKRAVFYMSRTMQKKDLLPPDTKWAELAMTSSESYAKNIDPGVMSSLSTQEDRNRYISRILTEKPVDSARRGPFALAWACSRRYKVPAWKARKGIERPRELRIVVTGTSNICRNAAIYMPYNYELVMNSLNWLAGEEDLKVIKPPRRRGTRLMLDQEQKDRILYLSVMILPEIFVIAGLAVWWRRR